MGIAPSPMRESISESVHARWETICYHHAKFHEIPPGSLGGDDEQRFVPKNWFFGHNVLINKYSMITL
jgi:hypothetical protein